MSSRETSFKELAGVPVHYDRLPEYPYGSAGKEYVFYCRNKLKNELKLCFKELFTLWPLDTPKYILSAGTIGDNENAHGQGLAFDLDGFHFSDNSLMMADFPKNKSIYLGLNAHLYTYFSNVLNYYYSNHDDHLHMDSNYSFRFRTTSNAQTFFVQSALRYIYKKNIGDTGSEHDGVDGVYGRVTKKEVSNVLKEQGLFGQGGLTDKSVWKQFLLNVRKDAFSMTSSVLDHDVTDIDLSNAARILLDDNDTGRNQLFSPLPRYGAPEDVVYLIRNSGSYQHSNEILGFKKDAINIKSNDVLLDFEPSAVIKATTDNTTSGGHRDAIQLIPPTGLHYAGYLLDSVSIYGANIRSTRKEQELQGITGFDGLYKNIIIKNTTIKIKHIHEIIFNGLITGTFENIKTDNPIILNPCRLCGGESIWLAEPFIINGIEVTYGNVVESGNTQSIIDNRKAFSQIVDTPESRQAEARLKAAINNKPSNTVYSHVDLSTLWTSILNSNKLKDLRPSHPKLIKHIKEYVKNNASLVYGG